MKVTFAKIIIFFCILTIFSSFLSAQPILKKIEGAKGRPGEIITLTLRGENLRQVVRIEKVRFDDDQINVIGEPIIESDEVIKLQIRIPFNAEPDKEHKISVLVANSQFERWLDSNDETTVVQFENPEIEILYNTDSVQKDDALAVDFNENEEGNFTSKTFSLKNSNDVPLSLSDIKLPPELTIVGTPPENIPANAEFTFALQLKPESPDNFDTQVQFSINGNPVTLQISAKAIPAIPLEPEIPDDAEKLVIVFDSTNVWDHESKALILKNIGMDTLTISQFQLPKGFISSDSVPIQIPAKDSAILNVKLDPTLLDTYDGRLQFAIVQTDTNSFNYGIAGELNKELVPELEITDGENIITSGQASTINFGTTSVGSPLQKTFTIRNTGITPLQLSNLKLPSGFKIDGNFPENIKSGETAAYTIELAADSAQNVSGNVAFNTNAPGLSLVSFPVAGTVSAEPINGDNSQKPTGVATVIVILSLVVGAGGSYFLLKGPGKKFLLKKSTSATAGGNFSFQFKPKTDLGLQNIKQKTLFKKHFEVRLKPVLDFGNQRIDCEGTLIDIETMPLQESKTQKADDLTRIEGIGPVISGILKENGITTYLQLSETNAKKIQQILDEAGIKGIADPTTWPQQAKLAAAEKWEELDKLQKELKGGRVVQEG